VRPGPLALQRFATKWGGSGYPSRAVDPGDIALAEYDIGRRLPQAYLDAIVAVGLPRPTASLLTSVVEADADFGDVGEFFTPNEIVERLDAFRTEETPRAFVAFASDSMGDRYGFLCPPLAEARPADSAVLRMDHETGEAQEIAVSFVDWLLDYDALAFVQFDDA
jgi:hypothetical protein